MKAFRDADVFDDDRGSLLALELAEVPFPVRRVFVVTGRSGGSDRGDHVVPCSEAIVLLSGSASFRATLSSTGEEVEARLDRRGQRLHLERGDHVSYRLADERSAILVLAEEPFEADR